MNPLIIGSGPNGLAAAFYLAKAGRRPVVLERSAHVGGGAITDELAPGFRCPTLTHEILIHEDIVRGMRLQEHGVELLTSDVEVCAPSLSGQAVVLHHDAARTAESLRAVNEADARAWQPYRATVARIASVLAPLFSVPPPDVDRPGARDLWQLLRAGRRYRALDRRDAYALLRWLPMPVADFVQEQFSSHLLCAAVAGPGVSGTMLGPRSAGSTLVLLLRQIHTHLAGGRRVHVRGGPGALTSAMAAAARAAGADIRTGVAVDRILTKEGRVTGVVAAGSEMPSDTIISTADPRTTYLGLIDPADLAPDTVTKLRNYRSHGTLAKVNLALGALPRVPGVEREALSGRIHMGPDLDYLERAFDAVKYGELSSEPWLEVTIPSLLDPQLAPPDAHVMSVYVHCAPHVLRGVSWTDARDTLFDRAMTVLDRFMPGVRSLVVASQVLTPLDLQETNGLSGGHVFHGELAPDQLFTMRPLIGYARYGTPLRGLYLGGGGTHPGGFLTGASGRLAAAEALRPAGRV